MRACGVQEKHAGTVGALRGVRFLKTASPAAAVHDALRLVAVRVLETTHT